MTAGEREILGRDFRFWVFFGQLCYKVGPKVPKSGSPQGTSPFAGYTLRSQILNGASKSLKTAVEIVVTSAA